MQTFFVILGYLSIAGIIAGFLILARKSNLLRDEIDNPAAFMLAARKIPKYASLPFDKIPRPFSLSRTQFALWTVIICCVYLAFMINGCTSQLTLASSSTTLALLGISAATTGLSGTIDKSQAMNNGPLTARHQNTPSQSFLFDLLSDENGISIHRFQNIVWTGVAIIVYCSKLPAGYCNCQLPDLDGTLLTLSGISNAAYLGLKINENKQ